MKIKTMIENTPVWMKPLHINERAYEMKKRYQKHADICPLCRNDLLVGDSAYSIMNNYKLFPNTLVHDVCVRRRFTTSLIDWPLIIKRLMDDWIKAEDNRKHDRCWYG